MATERAASPGDQVDWRLSRLATLVSLPPLAPFPLVRRVRRAVLGPGTMHLEAELCEAPMVAVVASDGVELQHDFRTRARHALRTAVLERGLDPDALRRVTRVDDLGMSPLLELEENLAWAYVTQGDPGPETDRLLADCLLSIVREERLQILDWAAGALNRLPERVLRTPAAWMLSELCAATRRRVVRIQPPELDQVDGDLLGEVARLLPTDLVGLAREGGVISFGPIARNRRVAFPVPAIVHRPVTVSWSGPDGPQEQTVELDSHSVVRLTVGDGPVRLRTLAGRVINLGPIPPGQPAPEIAELEATLDALEEIWRTSRVVRAQVVRTISAQLAIVRVNGAEGLNVLLRNEPLDEREGRPPPLAPGATLTVRISNFDRLRQRVVCRPALEPWTGTDLRVGAEIEGRYTNSVTFGIFVDLPTSPQGWAGPVVSGLVHTSGFPISWRWSPPNLAPGDIVRVRIQRIDPALRRIALTALDDGSDPLLVHPVGDVVTGELVKIVPFGVFIRLPSGVEALLHRSEIAEGTPLAIGLPMRVRITSIDEERGRISLVTDPRLPEGAPAIVVMPPTAPPGKPGPPVPRPVPRRSEIDPAEVTEFIVRRLRQSHTVYAAALAQQVIDRFGPGIQNGSAKWLGMGNFTTMLRNLIPGVRMSGNRVQLPR